MQNNQTPTTNKLFLVCPCSQLESLINRHYDSNSYYLTALGAVFNFSQGDYADAVADFIQRNQIKTIYLTQDTAGLFMRNILDKQPGFGTATEAALLNLLIDNYHHIMQYSSLQEKLNCFARFALEQQAEEIMANTLIQQVIYENGTCLKGLLINKDKEQVKEITLKSIAFSK